MWVKIREQGADQADFEGARVLRLLAISDPRPYPLANIYTLTRREEQPLETHLHRVLFDNLTSREPFSLRHKSILELQIRVNIQSTRPKHKVGTHGERHMLTARVWGSHDCWFARFSSISAMTHSASSQWKSMHGASSVAAVPATLKCCPFQTSEICSTTMRIINMSRRQVR